MQDDSFWNCDGRGHTRYQCPSPSLSKPKHSNECASCGKPGHRRETCKYRDNTCEYCHKHGHIESACFTKCAQAKRTLKMLDKDSSDNDDGADDDVSTTNYYIKDSSHRKEFFKLDIDGKQYINKNFVSGDRYGEPMYVDICVNDTNVCMEVDMGTYETVISEKVLRDYFNNVNICDTLINLRGYDGTVMNPVGKLSNLNVKFRNKNYVLDCYVLSGKGPALLECKWLAAFGCWSLTLTKNYNDNKR